FVRDLPGDVERRAEVARAGGGRRARRDGHGQSSTRPFCRSSAMNACASLPAWISRTTAVAVGLRVNTFSERVSNSTPPNFSSRNLTYLASFMPAPRSYCESTYPTADLISASDAATLGWPLPSFSFAAIASAAPLSALCFAAMSLKDGPIFFVSTAWQLRQPLDLTTSPPDCANAAPAATAMIPAIHVIFMLRSPLVPGFGCPTGTYSNTTRPGS